MTRRRPPRKRRVFQLEHLEDRRVLAADVRAFAEFPGLDVAENTPTRVLFHVRTEDFTLPGRQTTLTLGFLAAPAPGSTLDPGALVVGSAGAVPQVLWQDHNVDGGTGSLALVRVPVGSHFVDLSAEPGAAAPAVLEVFLAGDTNGDFRLDLRDLRTIIRVFGTSRGDAAYVPAADVFRDGSIKLQDLLFVLRNLGAGTTVRPLALAAALAPGVDPDHDAILTQPQVVIEGLTNAPQPLTLDVDGDGQPDSNTPADAQGRFQFDVLAEVGNQAWRIAAQDGFGQHRDQPLEFTRVVNNVDFQVTTDPDVQQNPSLAVNPRDPRNVVMAFTDRSLVATGYAGLRVAVSHDGGMHWQQQALPLPAGFEQGAAFPTVEFDDQGRVYIAYMAVTFLGPLAGLTNPQVFNPQVGAFEQSFGNEANNGIFLVHSDDGGDHWSDPTPIVANLYDGVNKVPFDRYNIDIAIDTFQSLPDGTPNPRYGTLYAIWTRFFAAGGYPGEPNSTGGSQVMIAISRDRGETWLPQLQPNPANGAMGSVIVDEFYSGIGPPTGLGSARSGRVSVGPEGDLYVSFFELGSFAVVHSTDGGQSFTRTDYNTWSGLPFGLNVAPFSGRFLNNQFRSNVLRPIVADPARPGYVYAAEAVQAIDPLGEQLDFADIRFARSTDYGVTWNQEFTIAGSSAVAVNDDNHGQLATGAKRDITSGQIMPELAIDAAGNIVLAWYDTRRDPNDHSLDVFSAVSRDRGQTFLPNIAISSALFDPELGKFVDPTNKLNYYIGERVALSLVSGTAFLAWTDTRPGNQDIFFSRYALSDPPAYPNDRFEPNNSWTGATNLGDVVQRDFFQLSVAPGDDDWFRLRAIASGELKVAVATASESLRIELWDANGQQVAAATRVVRGQGGQVIGHELVGFSDAGRSWHVRVREDGSDAVPYDIRVQSLTADLGSLVHRRVDGFLASSAADYYLVTAAVDGALEIVGDVAPDFQGMLEIQVLDPATLQPVADSSRGMGGVALTVPTRADKSLLLRISSADEGGTYELTLSNADRLAAADTRSLKYAAGLEPTETVVADFDGDGRDDLAVSNFSTDTVSVLLSNPDGTLQAPRQTTVGSFEQTEFGRKLGLGAARRDLEAADFNEDGITDLAVVNNASADISILLGRGDGTFEPQRRLGTIPHLFGVAVGDFNEDGHLDLVAFAAIPNRNEYAVMLGRGNGEFGAPQVFGLSAERLPSPLDAAVGDLDGDGSLDLVVSAELDTTLVLLGRGDGSFDEITSVAAVSARVGLADLNLDGKLDLLAAIQASDTFAFGLGKGDGTFELAPEVRVGRGPLSIAAADIGSPTSEGTLGPPDGITDIVLANSGIPTSVTAGPASIVVLPGLLDGQGQFQVEAPVTLATSEQFNLDVDIADLNQDGAPDIIGTSSTQLIVIYGSPLQLTPNDTIATARDLGTVVHSVQPRLTITPQQPDEYFRLVVPEEAFAEAGDQIVDVSALFQYEDGPGLQLEVLDAQGTVLGTGERVRVRAAQGQELFLRVFGQQAGGAVGSGAFTLVIDVLPQVAAIESQSLLPGTGQAPGGPTTSIVLTLQGDRLDATTAENPTNYQVVWLGADGQPSADDEVIPLAAISRPVVYAPSANVDVGSGKTYPTAVHQTITLAFDQPLPAGSYRIDLSAQIQTADFNIDEDLLLADPSFQGHPLVSQVAGAIVGGASLEARDLVFAAAGLGDFTAWEQGTPFLSQLRDDLSAILDAVLTTYGDDPSLTAQINEHLFDRLLPAVGAEEERVTGVLALWLDPLPFALEDPEAKRISYDIGRNTLQNTVPGGYVIVVGNMEIVVLPTIGGRFTLTVADIPSLVRGGYVFLDPKGQKVGSLTTPMRSGVNQFQLDL